MNSTDIAEAAEIIARGGVIAYPTEACYGIGCDPENRGAVERVLRIKNRPEGMGFILIADRVETLLPLLCVDDPDILKAPMASWPGPYTWIFPTQARLPMFASGPGSSVAVRVTAHPVAAQLCRAFGGALVSTSANRHGEKPMRTDSEVKAAFGDLLDAVVSGAVGEQKKPTQIRDAVTGRIVRSA